VYPGHVSSGFGTLDGGAIAPLVCPFSGKLKKRFFKGIVSKILNRELWHLGNSETIVLFENIIYQLPKYK